ncbi:16S rRNA (guanine(966)-N(2))-methyltransferase RsmD [Salinisphaera sp. SPP-AMP-43]|uniref:16S rRNA (guanine(966)-N(2))-methyltransferase RsmD n=1 Tax=Salinisphaera sp. SPP-AMP-43 TaxID=3121288 RepID=UPI003C6E4E44
MARKPRQPRPQPKHRRAEPVTSLRVIGGQWRSRVLPVADRPGLRPTPNRVRETLFNWLAPRIEGAVCVDLFAGTGALGIEALSRGAARAVFVERDRAAAAAIEAALAKLGASERAQVIVGDATDAARRIDVASADILFIDPPFDTELHGPALRGAQPLLGVHSRLYLEYPAESAAAIDDQLAADYEILRQSRSAGVGYCLARRRPTGEDSPP